MKIVGPIERPIPVLDFYNVNFPSAQHSPHFFFLLFSSIDAPINIATIDPPKISYISVEESPIVKKLRKNIREGRDLLMKAIKRASSKDGGILGSYLGLLLRKEDPKFSPEKYGCISLSEFIERYPDVLSASGRKHGEDILYKVEL